MSILSDDIEEMHAEWKALQDEYESIVFMDTKGEHAFERKKITDAQYERTQEISKRQMEICRTITESINKSMDRHEEATEPSKYPEHEKMRAVMERSQGIGEFLDWLTDEKGVSLCKWQDTIHHSDEIGDYTPAGFYHISETTEKLLAQFFDIDLDKIEAEKQAMLDAIREQHEEAS